ncbi:Cyclic di-GMP phosphodiesterase Gmr [Candidatus Venteria ishoeyi]|uniref:Cyclic di-GMP phosphodiesterase Gmr n=1 Tax=Candidatus Venteria ishoeyi TaxID=1899563 RepID=A0A1H6FEC5_9GAMM|nr:Cyclic di-GMP phosphodiesterase Gmr [Candidatus Venteria ishoeyi]
MDKPLFKNLLFFALLAVLGLLGNIFNVEMFFGVNQIFGSIFALLAVWRFGPWVGSLCAILIHSYTIMLWGHPYAFYGFVLEALTVGLLLRWRISNIFTADLLFWLLGGIWLVPLFYGQFMALPETQVTLIMLKQPVNGLLNALLAALLVVVLIRWNKSERRRKKVSLRNLLFTLLMTMIGFSLFMVANLTSRYAFEHFQTKMLTDLQIFGQYMQNELSQFGKRHVDEMRHLYLLNKQGKMLFTLNPAYKIDAMWRVSAQGSELLAGKAHLQNLPLPQLDNRPCNDNLLLWSKHKRLYLMVKVNNHCLVSTLKTNVLNQFLHEHTLSPEHQIYILEQRQVIASSNDNKDNGVIENLLLTGKKQSISQHIFHLLPAGNIPKMKHWKLSHYIYRLAPCANNDWSIYILASLSSNIDSLQQIYIFTFQVILVLILFLSLLSFVLVEYLSHAMGRLTTLTSNLPHKLEQREPIIWPESTIQEIMDLSSNFSQLTDTLAGIFKESEERYQKLFSSSQDAILVLDYPALTVIDYNPIASSLLGSALSRNKTTNLEQFFKELPPSLLDFNQDINEQICWLHKADDDLIPVRLDTQYHTYHNNEVLLLSIRDISHEIKAKEQFQLISVVFETTAEGIMVTDANSNILMVNCGFSAITGYSSEEVIGKNPNTLHSGWQDKIFYQEMWATLKHKGQWRGELWNRRKNGELYAEWLSIYQVTDQQGQASNYVGVFSDITEKKQAQDKINQLAYYDTLTGLPNRQLFHDRFEHAIAMSKRRESIVALMFIDLDNFKGVNDTLGHQAGDFLLKQIGERIHSNIRSSDTLARIGGDEFTVILENIHGKTHVAKIAADIMQAIAQPIQIEETEVFSSCSIGICFYPDDANSVEHLMQYADTAMYRAKEQGKNRFQFYTASMNTAALEQLQIEQRLRGAVERNQLSLHYQPQVSIAEGHIIGVEALLRWKDPELGFVSPDKFIPIAERTGLMGDIERWVLTTGATQKRLWMAQGIDIGMSLNISNHQFRKHDFVEQTIEAIQQSGIQCQHFDLELTERIVMDNEESHEKIVQLKAAGFKLSLDDFGTGQSSLGHLKRFNIDKLKIDKSFVDDIPEDSQSCDIARAITSLAQAMNMETVAEGVESTAQLKFLQELGCINFQGYLFSKAVSADELEQLWKTYAKV